MHAADGALLYVSDSLNHRVRVVANPASGSPTVSTLCGQAAAGYADGVGTNALFNNPYAVAVSATSGVAYVAAHSRVVTVLPDGTARLLAGSASGASGETDSVSTKPPAPSGVIVCGSS